VVVVVGEGRRGQTGKGHKVGMVRGCHVVHLVVALSNSKETVGQRYARMQSKMFHRGADRR
jgi:hypothetical protein